MRVLFRFTRNGFSLIELTVAMAVSGIVTLGVLATLNLIYSSSVRNNLLQARNELINKMRIQSLNPNNMIASAKVTSQLGSEGLTPDYGDVSTLSYPDHLKKCHPDITETGANGCNRAVIETAGKGFLFYLAENGSLDPEKTIAGEDVYYRISGIRCSSLEAVNPDYCPLFARVWFEPFCLNFAENCNKAMSLAIRYTIGLRSEYKNNSIISPVEGEFYIPLQRGIQIRSLLNQSDIALAPNSKGIYVIPKYYGTVGQTTSGLRFEAQVNNPFGLVSMRIQSRSLTGPDAKDYDDSILPNELLIKDWVDVPTPNNAGLGAWSINLTGAIPNQIFNFGTQLTSVANSRPPTDFKIGSDITPKDPKFRWTINSDGSALVPPTFRSGFYQFRILASDLMGGEIASSNYISIRLISTPEYGNLWSAALDRDCTNITENYSILVADDEALILGQVKTDSAILATVNSLGDSGRLTFSFEKNQVASVYPLTLTLKNKFSDFLFVDNGLMIPRVEFTSPITLSDIPARIDTSAEASGIYSDNPKIKINTTSGVSMKYISGNCCNATPTISWSYPSINSPDPSLLSGPASSSSTCSNLGNTRTCNSTITVTGVNIGPSTSISPDIKALLDLGTYSTDMACKISTADYGRFIPVVEKPSIGFLFSDSIWLNLPAGTTGSIKSKTPTAWIQSDFNPATTVHISVVNAANPTEIFCDSLEFPGSSTVGAPLYVPCNTIPPTFSGTLELKIKDGDPNAIKIEDSTKSHQFCQKDIFSWSEFPEYYSVPSTLDMFDSPYGTDSFGNQDTKNDSGHWIAASSGGTSKKLRCYDTWTASTMNSTVNTNNKQDYKDVYFNNLNPLNPKRNYNSMYQIFSTFVIPRNPPSMLDLSSKNIPSLFMVFDGSNTGKMSWRYTEASSLQTAITAPQNWYDATNDVCGASAKPRRMKLYQTPLTAISSSSFIIMKAVNGFGSSLMNGTYSYFFMCGYGRWHPSGKGSTNWID